MGRIRTHEIKKISHTLLELYGDRFTSNFKTNKEVLGEIKIADSKKTRNKIAGYIARVAKRRTK